MTDYGLEVDGNIGQVQINTVDNLSVMTAVQGPTALGTSTTMGTDGFDMIFARPATVSGTRTLYNRENQFQNLNTGYPTNTLKFKPSIAANAVRFRPMNNGALGSTVSLGNTQGNYGLQVFDSSGGTIYDSRKVSAGLDVVARFARGTKYHNDVLYNIPSGETLSDYYFCYYGSIYFYISAGIIQVNLSLNGAIFDYGNRRIKLAMNNITGLANTADLIIIKLKGG